MNDDEEDFRERVLHHLHSIERRLERMALDQATFDQELADLVQAVSDLDAAVDAFITSQPAGVDLTAEGQSVVDATAALKAELAKVQPAPAPGP